MPLTARLFALAVVVILLPAAMAQSVVSEIKLRADPENAKVRPLETLVVQLLAYSKIDDGNGGTKQVRIQPTNSIKFELKGSDSGWISKPFRFQGQESESFYEPQGTGLAAIIFQKATSQYVLQDSVLYTAPEKTGKYEIEAELDGKKASISIDVDSSAATRKIAEKTQFPAENRSSDPYRALVEHYAPFIAQETWFEPKCDFISRFDLDGDLHGDNNWEDAMTGTSQAYVYYAVMETDTHWFLIYNFYHPRDYSDKCVVGTCHENDNEGMILTVQKEGAFGRLLSMETLAHNNIYSFRADSRVQGGIHDIDGEVEFVDGSHPVIFIESGGHGVYGSKGGHADFDLGSKKFANGTGVTYVYKGKADRPRHTADREVGYELLPIYEHWWLRAISDQGRHERMFDEYFSYLAFGGRPSTKVSQIPGAFYGREKASNKARPFWGWFDNRTLKQKAVATGQWGLDPAYSASQDLRMPQPFSLNYTFNPYLGVGQPTTSSISGAQPAEAPAPAPTFSGETIEFRPKRSSDYNVNSRQGQIDLRFRVDLTMDITIQGDVVRYRFEGRAPEDDGSEYSQPIPQAVFSSFELEKKDGRGEITLLERPTAQNNYTAKLRITDSGGGDDRYHARLRWESAGAVPQPTQAVPSAPTTAPSAPVAASGQAAAAQGSSSILAKHVGVLQNGEGSAVAQTAGSVQTHGTAQTQQPAAGAAQPQKPPLVEAGPPLPGVQLTSRDNNPAAYNNANEGLFEFRGRVDGVVLFRIRGDRVYAENTAGRPPEVERFTFSQPLPAAQLGDIQVEQRDGRGDVTLTDRPSSANGFTATVQVKDSQGGDDRYHFRLTWRK